MSIAICAIVKDELDLPEWVEYHRRLGVDHFLIYDNESSVPVCDVLGPEIRKGHVSVRYVEGRGRHLDAYRWGVRWALGAFEWVAFIDADEFIVPREGSIERLLLKFDGCLNVNGVCLNWMVFGMNGHVRRPAGSVISNYTKRVPLDHGFNKHVKSIVRPELVVGWKDPHNPILKDGHFAVGEKADRVDGPFREPTHETAFIAHYWTKSLEDWKAKVARGRSDGVGPESERKLEDGIELDKEATEHDFSVVKVAQRLGM